MDARYLSFLCPNDFRCVFRYYYSVNTNTGPSTFSNISSETTGPFKLKFHMGTLKDVGTKVCSNGPGHMTKMAVTPIYGKNPL